MIWSVFDKLKPKKIFLSKLLYFLFVKRNFAIVYYTTVKNLNIIYGSFLDSYLLSLCFLLCIQNLEPKRYIHITIKNVFNKWGCVCKKDNEKVSPNNSNFFFPGL